MARMGARLFWGGFDLLLGAPHLTRDSFLLGFPHGAPFLA